MASAMHPAQAVLAQAKREVGRQGRGPGSGSTGALDTRCLAQGVVLADLEACAEDELRVVNGLLRRAAEAEVTEVRLLLGSAANSSSGSRRRARRADAAGPMVTRPEPNLALCTALKRGLRSSTSQVVALQLHGVKLLTEGAREVGEGLAYAPALRRVSFRASKLGDTAFKAMHLGLAKNASIQTLDLADCALSDRSAGAVAHVLRCHAQRRSDARWGKSLRRTGMHEAMLLKPEEFNEIAMMGLLTLDLANNSFGDGIGRAIAHELVADDWIGAINLQNNSITKAGVLALLDALEQSNDAIAVIDLRGNLDKVTVARLDALLRERSAFPDAGLLQRALPENTGDEIQHGASRLPGEEYPVSCELAQLTQCASQASSKADQVAAVFAEEIKRAIEEITANMDSSPSPLEALNRSPIL
ncbi:Centrosomal protein of 78 kDa [Hondaea fermentalgiana]|uniref:Centrosomal protein of 78 kDa n=1 Tax=Hondaea fermentalgiana TaxID=2315210 RepID=A0A2R5G5G0_9STRA|nr:Centrosomal protein of 78 kDa [Hondaea fermentalgiana]|eukprot:GBG26282.1 Centrosomal protein of 78 kDa [Hondaea fermentalgiana]